VSRFRELFPAEKVLIGMIHLPPLPDYDASPGIDAIIDGAVEDLHLLRRYGFDGVLVENEYDRPHRVLAEAATVDAMTQVTKAVVNESENCVVGCEILLNDPRASFDVARAAGAQFIRSDYFVDRMSRPDYGEFDIDPEGLIDYRESIDAADVLLFADIQVKYATMLEQRTLAESALLASQHRADAIVVSGNATGDAPDSVALRDAKGGAAVPVMVGSGMDPGNAQPLLKHCDGAIIGTALIQDGRVSEEKLRAFVRAIDRADTP
jgi:membrane complex biogenesis BtpA family protein